MGNPELSLAIPLYNEEANVAGLLGRLAKLLSANNLDYEIIAVDNGSIDRTGELISEFAKRNMRVRKVVVKVNEGYGNGVLRGLHKCRGDFVGFLWGDNQIPLSIIISVFK
ncbi:glycosyltransferase family 2 protein, partial [archaeon CG_4_8_14_3_um_filter_38_5]